MVVFYTITSGAKKARYSEQIQMPIVQRTSDPLDFITRSPNRAPEL